MNVKISERLKEGMRIRNLKQVDLVEKTGINKATLSQYISGKYEPKQNNIYLLAKALNVSEAWLMGFNISMERENPKLKTPDSNIGRIIKTVRLPMYGKASAGNGYINLSEEIGHFDVPVQYCTNNDVYTIKISGDSMTGSDKSIPDGSVAVVDPQLCSAPEELNGKVCIFTYNDETYIKQLIIDKQGFIRLKSFNPNYDDIIVINPEELRCEGRVILTFTENSW